MVQFIELELFSYCNRKCDWCPNKFIDRTHNINMDDKIFDKIMHELHEINYNGYISLSRYNEPMSQISTLLGRIEQIKKAIPECTIVFNTNGDYMKYINLLDGIDITVMDYDNAWPEKNKIMDRGGSLDIVESTRNRKCLYPTKFIGIDYNGNVMPCCDMRSDNPDHSEYIIGNIKDHGVIELYNKQQGLFNWGFETPCTSCQRELGRYICD